MMPQTPQTQEAHAFANVALYLRGGIGVIRTDCKNLRILPGQKWAQYANAVKVTFTEKGKRKERSMMLSYRPWLRVVDLGQAPAVASALIPDESGSSSHSRYASCDPRWETDFEDQLAAASVPVLFSIGQGERKEAAE